MYIIRNKRNGFFFNGYEWSSDSAQPAFEVSHAKFFDTFYEADSNLKTMISFCDYYSKELEIIDLSDKVPLVEQD